LISIFRSSGYLKIHFIIDLIILFLKMKDYHIHIFYSEDDKGYIADIPDLAFCSAFGNTQEEALTEVLKSKALWLESSKANNTHIPKPRYKPIKYQLA